MLHRATPERLSLFSDGVFAVLITILVLELRPPEHPSFEALLELWHYWLAYVVTYVFIAIVWTNHHHLLRYASETTTRLIWFNFAHLFAASLLPFATAWMAESDLAPQPVALYAGVFFLVNLTYLALIWELVTPSGEREIPMRVRRLMQMRALITLSCFAAAALLALLAPLAGLGLCILCLIVYLRPEPPGVED